MHRPISPASRSAIRHALRSMLGAFLLLAVGTSIGCHAVSGNVHNDIGQSLYREGNFAAARQEFHLATLDDPMNADYWHNLAAASRRQGDVVTAERLYRHAITVNPMHQPTYHSLAQMMRDNGRDGDAYNVLAGWADSQPYNSQAHVELAWIQRETGNVDGAEQSLRQALRIAPNHPTALAHLGQVYEERGNPQMAASIYRRSLAQNWYQPKVHSRLASLPASVGPVGPNNGAQMLAAHPGYGAPTAHWGTSPYAPGALATLPPQPTFAVQPAGAMQPQTFATHTARQVSAPALLGPPLQVPYAPTAAEPMISPAQQPVLLGTPTMLPGGSVSNADPAHLVPTMTSLPSVEAF